MKNAFKPLTAFLLALALSAAACGGAEEVSTVAGAGSDADSNQENNNEEDSPQQDKDLPVSDQPNTDEENNDETGGKDPMVDPASESANSDDPADGSSDPQDSTTPPTAGLRLIGTANIGGEIVSPQHQEIVAWGMADSYPGEIQVTFMGGDENCLAATATARISEDDTQVVVLLTTGITTDALTKSCLAGEFEHHLNIQLEVSPDGREVVVPGIPAEEPGLTAPPAEQPFEETLVGMREESAIEGAESFGFSVRVVERDGEVFAVTEDYRTDRINVVVNNGVIASAAIG